MNTKKWFVLFYLIVIIIALMGLLSYIPGLGFLGSIREDYIPMAPSTSISFIIYGATVSFLIKQYSSRFLKMSLLLPVLLVIIFSFLDVLGYFLGKELNFEGTFIPLSGTLNGIPIGRMSPSTGAFFVLAGIVLLLEILLNRKDRTGKVVDFFSSWLSILILSASIVFCLAYIYGTPLFYNHTSVIPMALTTAIAFIFLSLSFIFLSKESFPLCLVSNNTTKSYLFRYVLFLVFLSIIISSIAIYYSELIGIINPAFISSGVTIIVLFIGAILTDVISRHLSIILDTQKEDIKKSKQALEKSEEHFRTLFETMAQGVVYQNAKGEIISANPAAERILGLSLDQMRGRTSVDPRWKAVDKDLNELPGEKHPAMIALQTGREIKNFVQGIFNPKLNDYIWILVSAIPQFLDGNDAPLQVYSTFLDITERRKAELQLEVLKNELEQQVDEKTKELNERIAELEHFHEVTIERELRMEDLRKEIERLKTSNPKG